MDPLGLVGDREEPVQLSAELVFFSTTLSDVIASMGTHDEIPLKHVAREDIEVFQEMLLSYMDAELRDETSQHMVRWSKTIAAMPPERIRSLALSADYLGIDVACSAVVSAMAKRRYIEICQQKIPLFFQGKKINVSL
jgi:hypothetical protein